MDLKKTVQRNSASTHGPRVGTQYLARTGSVRSDQYFNEGNYVSINNRRLIGSGVLVAAVASLLGAPAALATENSADAAVKVLRALPAETSIFSGARLDPPTRLMQPRGSSESARAIEQAADVSVSAPGQDPIAVDLVASKGAAQVSVSSEGFRVLDNGDDSKTVPVKKEDGSLQIISIIESPSAPTKYAIDVDLPDGVTIAEQAGGALVATTPSGEFVLGATPAWAYDASGKQVPTRYEIEGNRIVQVVDHKAGNYAYPIAADPFLGRRLFRPMALNRKGRYRGQNTYSGRLTPWGVAVGLSPSWPYLGPYGWNEYVAAWPSVTNKQSLWQQYQCHVLWGRAIIGAGFWWDIERARPDRWDWAAVWAHRCNW